MRYIRNSTCAEDYGFSLRLFYQRLLRVGYTKGFLRRNLISYKEGLQCLESERLRKNLNGLFVYPMTYDKVGNVSTSVERILTNAKGGLSLSVTFFIPKRVNTKLRNLFCTRKMLQRKMVQYYS